MKKLYAQLFALAFAVSVCAVSLQAQDKKHLHLQSGKMETSTNIASLASLKPKSIELTNGYYYRIAQFKSTATDNDRQKLINAGLQVFGYLPEDAFLVGIPFYFQPEQWKALGVFAVVPLEIKHKIDLRLAKQDWPEWAIRPNNQIALNVRYFDNLPVNHIKSKLKQIGIEVSEVNTYESNLIVTIGLNQINQVASMPEFWHIEAIQHPGDPENLPGVTNHRSNFINPDYAGATKFDGEGVIVAMGDDGIIGPHIDYTGRVDQTAVNSNGGNHGDHVAGIIFGAGNLNPITRGMAPGATLFVYQVWNAVNQAPISYDNPGVRLTSTSYGDGCNAGYTTFAQTADRHIRENKSLLHIFSAGNSGTSNCNYGAGAGWGNITGGVKVGKNTIAVGNVDASNGLNTSSSKGPAHDGRIKPDIAAVGTNVLSTVDVNTYATFSGTSMAAPGVTGVLAQLYQAYRQFNNNEEPHAGLMKGLIMNTADDLGNFGPDFSFGYGRINAKNALQALEQQWFVEDSINSSQTKTHTIQIPAGLKRARVMVYWVDREALPNAATALVNDLNMEVVNTAVRPNPFLPLVLDPTPAVANLTAPAVEGIDSLNNVEQVTLMNPQAGTYIVNISANRVVFGPQTYQLLWFFETDSITLTYPIGGEGLVPGVAEQIRWDAVESANPFILEISTNNGSSWSRLGLAPPGVRVFNFTPTASQISDQALIRVSSGGYVSTSFTNFSIAPIPQNININYNCPDSLGLVWDSVPGALGYVVYRLGNKYMDSVMFVSAPMAKLTGLNPLMEDWFSVATVLPNGGKGRRANAIMKSANSINCIIDYDIALKRIISPNALSMLCGGQADAQVTVEIANEGLMLGQVLVLNYAINGTVVSDSIPVPAVGGNVTHTFSQNLINLPPGSYQLLVYVSYLNDQNSFNDSLWLTFEVVNGMLVSGNYSEFFENQTRCAVATTCEAVSCNLTNGWRNVPNLTGDDIDWRVHRGTTATNNTGPSTDFNLGTAAGQYLYLESSLCFDKEAILISPCFDLSGMQSPEFRFAYHMFGAAMGSLRVDVYHNKTWILDVIPPIFGNQGNQWLVSTIGLQAFAGDTIQIRFRGRTGNNFTSDMALDAFVLQDNNNPPVADIRLASSIGCANSDFAFFDNSTNNPTSWLWSASPANATFVGGTNSTSQNPVMRFNQAGTYSITLVATNAFGSDTLVRTNLITVTTGEQLPLTENFDVLPIPSAGWEINNFGNTFGWNRVNVGMGANGRATAALRANNFSNNQTNTISILNTPPVQTTGLSALYLVFDLAYAMYQNTGDTLLIEVSPDCGATWIPAFYKGGSALATSNPQNNSFSPTNISQWRKEFVDLSAFVGGIVQVRFVNKNMYGNNLFIDNIYLNVNANPTASFSVSAGRCVGTPITFTNNSQLGIAHYFNFGFDANPTFSTSPAGANVTFSSSGPKQIWLAVTNMYGTDTLRMTLNIDTVPIAAATATILNNTTVDFQYTGTSNAGVVDWNFGDGNMASGNFQNHSYAAPGIYQVLVTATNLCGVNTDTLMVDLLNLSSKNLASDMLNVFPNPSKGIFELVASNLKGTLCTWELRDVGGRLVHAAQWPILGGNLNQKLNLSNMEAGVYLGTISHANGQATIKLVITK